MARSSAQNIGKTRPPRVHIVYEVDPNGSEKAIELPFVLGVMSDLSGMNTESRPEVQDRRFEEFDIDNFDGKMAAIAPRATFQVKNTLTGEGNLTMDLTFRSMSDFSPAALAKADPALEELLKARDQLMALRSYMDGKSKAQALLDDVLQNPTLLGTLAAAKPIDVKSDDDHA